MNFIRDEFELVRNLPLDSRIKFSPPASNKSTIDIKSVELTDSSNRIETENDKLVNNDIGDN